VIEADGLPSLERAKVFTNKSLVLSHLGRTNEGLEAALAALAVDPTWDKVRIQRVLTLGRREDNVLRGVQGYVRKAAMLKAEGEADDATLRLVLHEGLRACPMSKALMVALLEFEAERGGRHSDIQRDGVALSLSHSCERAAGVCVCDGMLWP
jgi:hypothetical protein